MDYFNQSQYGSWMRCQKEYDYRYNQELIRKYAPPYMNKGTAIHKGLMALLIGESPEGAISKWKESVIEMGLDEVQEEELSRTCETAFQVSKRTFKQLDIGHK